MTADEKRATNPRKRRPAKRSLSFRIAEDDLAVIDDYARERRLDRTAYLVLAGRQELDDINVQVRLDEHEQRIKRLEALNFPGAW